MIWPTASQVEVPEFEPGCTIGGLSEFESRILN